MQSELFRRNIELENRVTNEDGMTMVTERGAQDGK